MTHSEAIRHNARLILKQVRGKSRKERWQIYARLMLGIAYPIVHVHNVIVNEHVAFDEAFSGTWDEMRKGARQSDHRFRL